MTVIPVPDEDLLNTAAAEAADARDAFRVDLEGFEGPLHLLLELARRHKIDLAKISILKLADQYLAYVREAQDRKIDIAADYLLMAAWLAFLKSKLLLPSDKKGEDETDPGEIAGRLAFRLRRLDAMRKAVNDLYAGHVDNRDVFRRGDPQLAKVIRKPIWTTSLHDILKAFGDINTRKVKLRAHVIKRQPVLPLDSARRHLAALAPELVEWASIQEMHANDEEAKDAPRRSEVASFFSAALELTKDRAVELRQDQPFSDVYVRRARDPAAAKAAE
ncbi:MAG TPA: ScpA family protein [Hyphomonadaceae bacterium]|nr:ScpA family protein [Hyphomonadaceae bacterium]